MRHHSNIRKFGREKTQRHALLRSLARNLIRDSRIKTTTAKAKELVAKIGTGSKSKFIDEQGFEYHLGDLVSGNLLCGCRIEDGCYDIVCSKDSRLGVRVGMEFARQ